MRSSEMIDIVSSCDENYAQHLAVVLKSIIHNASSPQKLRFWILTSGITEQKEQAIRTVIHSGGAAGNILEVDKSKVINAPISGHISLAAYYRILLPELLPRTIDKVIYVDADLVVLEDIEKLASIPLGSNLVGAVLNPRFSRWESLRIDPSMGYFNSGVLLVNLSQWRLENLQQQLCAVINTESASLKLHDQDALNRVVAGRWLRLDPRWNQQYSFFLVGAKMLGLSNSEYRRLLRKPFIAHYSGGSKPWVFSDDHPLKSAYYRYLDMTPHAGWRPAGGTPRAWLRRAVLTALPHRLRPALLGL